MRLTHLGTPSTDNPDHRFGPSQERDRLTVTVSPRRTLQGLVLAAVAIVLMGSALQVVRFITGHDSVFGLTSLFNLDGEGSIPSYFSAQLLLLASILLWLLGRTESVGRARPWNVLASLTLLLGIDEAVAIHERALRPIKAYLDDAQRSDPTWVVAAGLAAISAVSLVWFLRWTRSLPARTRLLLAIAAFVYFAGAVGVDAWSESYKHLHSGRSGTYVLLASIEETLEIAGLLLGVSGLFRLLQDRTNELSLHWRR